MANTIKITREFINEAVMVSLERILREGIMEKKDSDKKKKKKHSDKKKKEKETDEQKETRRAVLEFLREPGRDLAIYAYRMAGINPEDVDSHDDNELGGIRSAFYKKVDGWEDPKTGFVHHFTTEEINDLKNMIDSETNGK